jgi:hypothetical protein
MFKPTREQLSGDWAARAVDFGGYKYAQFFVRYATNHQGPLPATPPPAACYDAGERCRCPSCLSEGWFAVSPRCRFWRAECRECWGTRQIRIPGSLGREPCEQCLAEWRVAVRFFRHALRSPKATAQRLRVEAARAALS